MLVSFGCEAKDEDTANEEAAAIEEDAAVDGQLTLQIDTGGPESSSRSVGLQARIDRVQGLRERSGGQS